MKQGNLKEKAYSIIKNKIINCEFVPGSFLSESELMLEIGASRTPIREALNKLEQEHLVKIIPKRGVLVCEISIEEINDIYQVRELIEPYIIRMWGTNLNIKDLIEFKQRIIGISDSISQTEMFKLDDDLHQLIINACKNRYFVQLLYTSYDQNHRMRIISGKEKRRLEDSNKEHIELLNFLIEKDYQGAAELMTLHLRNARKATFDSLCKTDIILK